MTFYSYTFIIHSYTFIQINQQEVSKKTGKKIYERPERGGREPPGKTTPWLIDNVHFCYDRELHTNNDNEKNNNTFYSMKKT